MLIYQEQDLLQLSKICGVAGAFSQELTKPLHRALSEARCAYILFGLRDAADFALSDCLLDYRENHPLTRLIFIYNPKEAAHWPPSAQKKIDLLLDQMDIVYHGRYAARETAKEIAIFCQQLIILNHQQEADFLHDLAKIQFDDPIIKL